RLNDLAKVIDLSIPSDSSMRRRIRLIGCEAIQRVFNIRQEQVRTIAKDVAGDQGLQVSIDGQYCTPGFNASNCKVTVIDCETRFALAGVAVHKKEEEIDNKSIRMESVGALRALEELIDDGFTIRTRVNDQNATVNKKLREHPKTAAIVGKHDWWHVIKPLRKDW
ncbi:hypothetical protein PFISCL1PPCAC_11672, partial [Pristionchus fissidentatus]